MDSAQELWMVFVRHRISSMLCDESRYRFHDFTRDLEREWADEHKDVRNHIPCFLAYHGALAIPAAPDPMLAAAGLEAWIVHATKSNQ